jgi:type II secretory pathway component PulK
MRHNPQNSSRRSPKAVILLAVLVVVVLLTLAAYQYSELVVAEYRAADSYARSGQAKAYAASGVHYVAAIVGNSTTFTNMLNGNPYDNPTAFQGIIVAPSDDPRQQGRFSIVSPLGPDDTTTGGNPFHYGVIDESGKININALMKMPGGDQKAHDVLMGLPGMTEEIVNSILDWIDPDDTPRSSGAENDYYSTLNPPYRCKNGPLSTPEELLLVKGVTPPLFLGNDFNRNGILDPGEDDGTGVVSQGWSAYLTVYSREVNLASDSTAQIYVNDSDLNNLNTNLQSAIGPDLANFIIMYRMYGPAPAQTGTRTTTILSSSDRSRGVTQVNTDRQNYQQRRLTPITSLFDLVNADVMIPANSPQQQPIRYPSPLKDAGMLRQLLPTLLDKVTASNSSQITARVINVNTAPRAVLEALLPTFNLTDTDVQTIIDHRPTPNSPDANDPIYQTPAWLITEANLNASNLSALDKYITARSLVYRIQSIGYFDGGGPTARIEAVIDASNQRPRIVSWRDLTELGKGFNISPR